MMNRIRVTSAIVPTAEAQVRFGVSVIPVRALAEQLVAIFALIVREVGK
jgi:hypothetical protein